MTLLKQKNAGASTAKIALWYIISNVFGKGLAVISTPIFTRIMSKTEYGLFSNITSWESVLTVLVTLDLISSIARAKYDFDEKMEEYLSSILALSNVVTLFTYFAVELKPAFFVKLFGMDIFYIRVLFVYLLFMPAFNFLQIKHRIYQKYKFCVVASMGSAIVRTGVSIVLVMLMDNKLMGRTIGYFLPVSLLNFAFWIYIMYKGHKISWNCIKYACKISIPLIPHDLAGILLGSVDKIMITNYCGSEENALYSVAYTISMLAYVVQTSMNQAWTPWLFDKFHEKDEKEIRKNSNIYMGVYAVIILGVFLVAPEVIYVLGGKAYYSAKYAMPPIILGCAYQFFYTFYVNIEIFKKRTFTISIGTVAAALLNIFLNWLLIPKFGYLAAAYTTMIGYLALLGFHYWIVRRTAKEFDGVYNKKFLALTIVGLTFAGMGMLGLYRVLTLRIIFLVIYVVVLSGLILKNRKVLWKLLH